MKPATEESAAEKSAALAEAERLMIVCNSCRYCEGLCAVFPAMEMRRQFAAGDLTYLANLCHGCGACYHDCQFSPPHAYDVNVPQALARLRHVSYRRYAWPSALGGVFERNGLAISLAAALSVTAFIIGFIAWNDAAALFAADASEGAFYRLMPHASMALLFGAAFVYMILAIFMGLRAFWRDIDAAGASLAPPPVGTEVALEATGDALTLRYLDGGGGPGCANQDQTEPDRRRLHHHLTFYGFMLCFAATCVATLYHYLLGREAPYPWWDLPVLLGTLGGVGLIVGPIGLLRERRKRDPITVDTPSRGMDTAFLVMLLLTSVTGLALFLLRATPAMGVLLALHLGVVFALFLTMPYGKFVHGFYRYAALLRYARERRAH